MIKLIFNRFVTMEPIGIPIKSTADTTGFKQAENAAKKTKASFTELNKTGITINTTSIDNTTKKVNYLQSLLKTLKANPDMDIKSNLSLLKKSRIFNTLPKDTQKLLSNLGNIQSGIKDDDKYAKLMKSLIAIDNILKSVKNDTNKADDGFQSFLKTMKDMPTAVDAVTKAFKGMDFTKLVNLYRTVKRTSTVLINAVENAAGYEESLNLYSMAFGEYTQRAGEWADEISEKLKLDPSPLMQYAGAFYNLTKGIGVTSEHAYIMSKNLTQLTYDMASYLNISNEAAQAKIQSAMAGQSRAVQSVGVATQVASLQELAYAMGIKKSVSEMTQAEKTYLRYIQLMKSTTQMQGDLGKTMITPANAIRALKNQINLLSRAIGQVLTPIIMKAIPYIMALTNVLTAAAQSLAAFFGYEISDVDFSSAISFEDIADDIDKGSSALDGLGASAKKAGKQVSESLAPFDELNNVISESDKAGGYSSSGGVGGVGGKLLDNSIWDSMLPQYDMLSKYNGDLVNKAKSLEGTMQNIAILSAAIFGGSLLGKFVGKFAEAVEEAEKFRSVTGSTSMTFGEFGAMFKLGLGEVIAGIAAVTEGFKQWKSLAEDIGSGETSIFSLDYLKKWASESTLLTAGGTLLGTVFSTTGVAGPMLSSFLNLKTLAVADEYRKTHNQLLADENEKVVQLTNSVKEYNTAQAEGLSSMYKQMEVELTRVDQYQQWADRLYEIVDAEGNVKKGHEAEANVLIDKLNGALGTNIKLRDGQVKGIKKVKDELDKLIEKKRAEIIINHMEESYAKGLMDEEKAIKALADAQKALNKAQENANNTRGKTKDTIEAEKKALEEAQRQYDEASKHYNETIKNKESFEKAYKEFLKGHYDEVNKIYKNSSDDTYKYIAESLARQTEELNGGELSEELINAWAYLAKNSSDEFNAGIKNIADPETRQKILDAVSNLGIEVVNKGSETGENYADNVVNSAQSELDKDGNKLEPKVEIKEGEKKDLVKNLKTYFKTNEVDINISAKDSPAEIFKKFKNYFLKNPFKVALDLAQGKLSGILGSLKITGFAGGGFPTSGDLFFANENGNAEYITSIGNQTAVANQGQMVTALTNAIVAGFQQFGGNQASNVTVYVGDKKLYQGQGEYQNRQNDRYGTTVVRI